MHDICVCGVSVCVVRVVFVRSVCTCSRYVRGVSHTCYFKGSRDAGTSEHEIVELWGAKRAGTWLNSTRDPAGSRYDMLLGAQHGRKLSPEPKGECLSRCLIHCSGADIICFHCHPSVAASEEGMRRWFTCEGLACVGGRRTEWRQCSSLPSSPSHPPGPWKPARVLS